MTRKTDKPKQHLSPMAAALGVTGTEAPLAAAVDGPRLYPLAEARARLRIGSTTMAQLVKIGVLENGGLPSLTIGRFRYVTAEALQAYINRRIELSAKPEVVAERMRRVEAATAESLRSRGHRRTAT